MAVDHIFLSVDDNKRPREYQYLGSSGGGTVSNILTMLSLLGHKTTIFGITGNDIGQRIVREDFLSFDVNYDLLVQRGNRTDIKTTRQYSHRILQNGKHYFDTSCLNCGNKFTIDYQMSKKDLSNKVIETAKNKELIIDRANSITIQLSQNAINNNKKIIYNFDFDIYGRYNQNNETLLGLCDVVKTNDYTIKKFINKDEGIPEEILEKYPKINHLFVTNGEKGVYGFSKIGGREFIFNQPSTSCKKVRDSGGSGDIFLSVLISELIGKNNNKRHEDFIQLVNKAQALASLNCTLYGARSLQHFFLKENIKGNEILSIALDILTKGSVDNPFSPYIGLSSSYTKPYRLSRLSECNVCGSFDTKQKEKISQRQQRLKKYNLHKSLETAPWTMISSYNIGKTMREAFSEVQDNGAYFIGSGGSLSAGVFAETIIQRYYNKLAKSISPYELESYQTINPSIPVCYISHGGNNSDILGSALWAKKHLNVKKGICLLGNRNSKLAENAKEYGWHSVFVPFKERYFVSLVGYLSQVSAFCGLLAPNNKLNELDDFFSERTLIPSFNYYTRSMFNLAASISPNTNSMQQKHIVGLARGWGWPALFDFESKIVEGGVCTIELSELKNYTHGRYINSFGAYNRKNRVALTFEMPEDQELSKFINHKFGKYIAHKTVRTEQKEILGSLELILQSILLAWYIGQIAKKNILKPKFPREARGLYGWEPEWRKNEWKTK